MARERRPDERPIPDRPYRDAALVYGIMAVALVVTAALTGSDLMRAILVAIAFFVLAMAWSSWRFRTRIKRREAAAALAASTAGADGRDPAGGNGSEGAS